MTDSAVCVDQWGMPFYVGNRVTVYDGNPRSPTFQSWLRGRVYKLVNSAKLGIQIEEGGHWDCMDRKPKQCIPVDFVRHVDVDFAVAVVAFRPNAENATHAKVVYSRESDKLDEWIPIEDVFASPDLRDAKALEKWTKVCDDLTTRDPNCLEELGEEQQEELAYDIEKAIRSDAARRTTSRDERTFQWRLLKLATTKLLSKYCVQPQEKLRKVAMSWKLNRDKIPLGNEVSLIIGNWERFKRITEAYQEKVAEPEFTYTNCPNGRVNSYGSLLNPNVTHAFFQINYPRPEGDLKKFPVGLEEYPEGELPAQPPGPCTKEGCDPGNNDHFCFKDEVRRSEPPKWRKAAMNSDPCDEFEAKNDEERNEFRKKKWADRTRYAYAFNAEVDFLHKFGVPTKRPIALSSYYSPTVGWRRDVQLSIEKRLTTVPISAFYEENYVFRVPYTLWATTSSPSHIEVSPEIPGLVVDPVAHTLDGRKVIINAQTTLTLAGHPTAARTPETRANMPTPIKMTLIPVEPCNILPGISESPLIDLKRESWKDWVEECRAMPLLETVAKLLDQVIEMDEIPMHPENHSSTWLHRISILGDVIHFLRTIPTIQSAPYLEGDIRKFEEEIPVDMRVKRGHVPENERMPLQDTKKPKLDMSTSLAHPIRAVVTPPIVSTPPE